MADTVSDFLVKRLSQWGVRRMSELILAALDPGVDGLI